MANVVCRAVRLMFRCLRWLLSEFRKLKIRLENPTCEFGKSVAVGRGVSIKVTDGGSVRIGDRTCLKDDCTVIVKRGSLSIGSNCFIGWGSVICAIENIEIGNDCLIAEHVSIRDQNHGFDISKGKFADQPMTSAPIKIGDNAWLGAKSTIVAGVVMGSNSVVAANSVVNRDVEEATIVGGVPAKLIRQLASE